MVGTHKVRQQWQKYKIGRKTQLKFTGKKYQKPLDIRHRNKAGVWQVITKEGIQEGSERQDQRKRNINRPN